MTVWRLERGRALRTAATALAVCLGYYVGANLGFILRFPPSAPSIMWPPNAILTVTLLLTPPRRWWIYLLAAFPAHLAAELGAFPLPLVLFPGWLGTLAQALPWASYVQVPADNPQGYAVPKSNPFAGRAGILPEIWAFGLRNPWRYNFDDPARGGTGALVIGDVGQNRFEEVDYEPANRGGRNYGWRNLEGLHDNVTSRPPAYLPLVDPIHEYDHATGQSITGGFVYRGTGLPAAYRGRYFFADYVQGRVWSLALTVDGSGEGHASDLVEHTAELTASARFGLVSSFGVDATGELYIVSYTLGRVFKIIGPPAAPPVPSGLRIVK